MINELKIQASKTFTENGAITYATTLSDCLDLFATIGALRQADDQEIIRRFIRAYTENPDIAMKILFYARDVRGGLGERRVFRLIVNYLGTHHMDSMKKNIPYVAEYGRYDDLLYLLGTPCEEEAVKYIKLQMEDDLRKLREGDNSISLLAKWLPSVNASNQKQVSLGKKLAKDFDMSEKEYRKNLSALRRQIDIIENHLRTKDYSFDYSKQCSKAMLKYRKAFLRNDNERYNEYLEMVSSGTKTLHTGTLMPYEIIRPFINYSWCENPSEEEAKALNVEWDSLEDYTGDQDALVVIDGSGSMYNGMSPMPATVAFSLGLYFAERNQGRFRNHFITFSHRPQLISIKGTTLKEKLEYIRSFDEVADTDIQAVFDLVLATALNNHLPQEEMPERIIIVSDMEFNYCARSADTTNFELAKNKYHEAGYRLPQIVFWNVASRNQQLPVTKNEQGVVLVSGCTSKLFEQVALGVADPYQFMIDTVSSKRYEEIHA